MLTFKNKKETENELAHTQVYQNDKYLGYFLPNKSKYTSLHEHWNFVSECKEVQYFYADTKKELVETLNKQVNKKYVKLKQHFGIITELNVKTK